MYVDTTKKAEVCIELHSQSYGVSPATWDHPNKNTGARVSLQPTPAKKNKLDKRFKKTPKCTDLHVKSQNFPGGIPFGVTLHKGEGRLRRLPLGAPTLCVSAPHFFIFRRKKKSV